MGARELLVGGTIIDERIVRHGPFVVNTREQVAQAFADYEAGTLAAPIANAGTRWRATVEAVRRQKESGGWNGA